MLFAPMLCMLVVMEFVMLPATVMIAMTEPMPMMMPSIVSSARILLARRPLRASWMFSNSSIRSASSPAHARDAAVLDGDDALAFAGKLRAVGNEHDGLSLLPVQPVE